MPSQQILQLPLAVNSNLLIATDIDGTLLSYPMTFSEEEILFFTHLSQQGVIFLFVTGRTEKSAKALLEIFPFPFFLSAQNGASLWSLPEERLLKDYYLELDKNLSLEKWIMVGKDGISYYSKEGLSSKEETHLLERAKHLNEIYLPNAPLGPIYALKRYGVREELEEAAFPLIKAGFSVFLTKDAMNPALSCIQATPKGVNKGRAIEDVLELLQRPMTIIGCGDDDNDLPLFEKAHLKIAIEHAPKSLLKIADKIASKGGLFKLLKEILVV